MLLLCTKDRAKKRIEKNREKLTLAQLNKTIHKIPDNIIDIDTSIVEQYMEEDAWEELQQTGNVITIRVHKNISYATFSAQKTIRTDVHSLPSLYNRNQHD